MVRQGVRAGLTVVAMLAGGAGLAQAWDRGTAQFGSGVVLPPRASGTASGPASGYGGNVYVVPPSAFVQPYGDPAANLSPIYTPPPPITTPAEVLSGTSPVPCGFGQVFDTLAGFCKRR